MTRRKVLLLVEDNPDDVELTLLAFETSGIENQVVVARDGVEALDYLFSTGAFAISIPNRDWYIANSTPTSKTLMGIDLHYTIDVMVVVLHPDYNRYNLDNLVMPAVVLLDLQLPRINGLEVLQRMRADDRTRLLPVIVLTTSNDQQDLIDSYSGCNSYIRLPCGLPPVYGSNTAIGNLLAGHKLTPTRS